MCAILKRRSAVAVLVDDAIYVLEGNGEASLVGAMARMRDR
jgi:hypothetical protein